MLALVTDATEYPISRTEMKLHLRIDHTEEDALIDGLIAAATYYCQKRTTRQFVTATWKDVRDKFPSVFHLRMCPAASVTSIAYTDTDGAAQTVAASDYQTDFVSEPARVMPAYGESWPSTRGDTFNAVVLTFTAGYGAATAVPQGIKDAIKHHAAMNYRDREAVDLDLIDAMLIPFQWGTYR